MQVIAVFAVLIGLCVNGVAARAQGQAEKELMQFEHDWCAALMKNDLAWLTRFLSDDFTHTDSTGRFTKKQMLDFAKSDKFSSCKVDQMHVRVFGTAAVVTGHSRISGTDAQGKPFPEADALFTDTFVRRGDTWQCVASQHTAIAKR